MRSPGPLPIAPLPGHLHRFHHRPATKKRRARGPPANRWVVPFATANQAPLAIALRPRASPANAGPTPPFGFPATTQPADEPHLFAPSARLAESRSIDPPMDVQRIAPESRAHVPHTT